MHYDNRHFYVFNNVFDHMTNTVAKVLIWDGMLVVTQVQVVSESSTCLSLRLSLQRMLPW